MTPGPVSNYYPKYSWFYPKRKQYYEEFYEVDVTSNLVETLAHIADPERTVTDIEAFQIPFSSTQARLVSEMGSPRYYKTNKQYPQFSETALFYKKAFYKSRVIVQFNFIDGNLAYCIATFLSLNRDEEARLIDLVAEKYQVSEEPFWLGRHTIVDSKGSYIIYDKDVHPRIIYVNNPSALVELCRASERELERIRNNAFERHEQYWSNLL